VKIGGQEISDQLLTRIRQTVESEPGLSRAALSRRVCQWLNWRGAHGKLQQMSCRVALLKLHRQGVIELPASRPGPPRRLSRRRVHRSSGAPSARAEGGKVRCSLKEVGAVELVLVGSADSRASRDWTALMERHHYLGAGPLCGAQLRYLIGSRLGWLGGLAFSAAAWQVAGRDQWIGWNGVARQQNLQQVVANSRFLILPHREVPHLASHVLGLVVKRLAADWRHRYGYEPRLIETYVEQQRFRGTCYRAANWIEVGRTQGRGRQDRTRQSQGTVKRIYVYPLGRQARQQLQRVAEPARRPVARAKPGQDWAEEEFGRVQLGDRRLEQRLLTLARDFYAQPQAQVPQACQSRAKTKAAYRFFDHSRTKMERLLEPHYQSTSQRIGQHRVVLAVQDTSSLNYTVHPATERLGSIGSKLEHGPVGLLLHDTMAFTPEGTPLGLLDVQCWARDQATWGKKHRRKQRPIEEKESFKWLKSYQQVARAQQGCPDTMLVSVGDREADIYELFQLARADPSGPQLLIRAEQDRLLSEGQAHLWEHLEKQAVGGSQWVQVPRRGPRPARQAQLQLRWARVTLKAPQDQRRLKPLSLWAVLAQETEAPPGTPPLSWLLLTTCPVTSFQQASEKLAWYTVRWNIEVYHKTLKSGCQIEQRQLGLADRIEACLAIDLVVAWRIFHLAKLGRETPDVPCTVFFAETEWKALLAYVTKNPQPPPQPPSLREAMRLVATLGGFLGRKGDGEPGTQTLWLGLQRLDDLAAMWNFMSFHFAPQLRSPPVSRASTYG
jgi:uncharacterized protein DUF4338/transposase-like protein/transposase Tn5 family protein